MRRPRARRLRARATRSWSWPLALALLAAPGLARAEVAAPLRLTLVAPGCQSIDQARLRELVAIEVATISADAQPRATAVRLACAGNHIVIDLTEALATPGSHSELDVDEATEATRLRVLALAITEQVALSWRAASEARASVAGAPAPPPARVPDLAVSAGPSPAAASRASPLYAQASLRRAGRPGAWLTGVGVGGELTLTRWLALALALDAETGDATTSAATVAWNDLSSFVGVAVGAGGARWRVTARPGFTVGLARLSPTPDAAGARGTALSAAWAGPSLALLLRRSVGRAVFVQLDAEGGLTTRRIVGLLDGDSPLFQVAGPWASLGLGAGFMLGR